MNNTTIRIANLLDLEAVYQCYAAICHQQQFETYTPLWELDLYPTREDMEDYIHRQEMLVMSDDTKIIGVMALKKEPQFASVHLFGIDPAYRGQGLASLMLKAAEKQADSWGYSKIMLDVIRSNLPARKLYEKHGYQFLYDFERVEEKEEPLEFAMYEKVLAPTAGSVRS